MPKTTKINFTVLKIERELKHEGGPSPTYYWDTGAPGLGLKITSAGSRIYAFQKRLNGETIRTVIGAVGAWKLPQAQAEARKLAMSA